ncbi:TetR family transcriptional regulator, partial [uncultured Bradyrhizobium sp.]|uniref:TetR family transcriptional regulator n=1 Tax=uncultured Bradyrhizobium sp. TaxID=199684 RepID=UPI002633F92F
MGPKDRILDATMLVFRRHGFRRSSIEQVAEAAGLTRQALYHHFESKEALFRAVIERVHEAAIAAEDAAVTEAETAGGDLGADDGLDRFGEHLPVAVEVGIQQRLEQRGGVPALFEAGRARDTIALWCAFFLNLLAVYSAFSWLPTMLNAAGLDVAVAGSGLTAYNFGGVFGALLCAVAIARFGSRGPLLLCAAGGAVTA